jgi:hypothetical protein
VIVTVLEPPVSTVFGVTLIEPWTSWIRLFAATPRVDEAEPRANASSGVDVKDFWLGVVASPTAERIVADRSCSASAAGTQPINCIERRASPMKSETGDEFLAEKAMISSVKQLI